MRKCGEGGGRLLAWMIRVDDTKHSTDETGRRLRFRTSVDLGAHLPEDPTYGFAKSVWGIGPRGFPGAEVRLDDIRCGDGLAVVEDGDGAPEPDTRELTVVDEATGVWQPRLGQHVEPFVQTALGMGREFGGVLRRGGALTARLTLVAALAALGGPALGAGLVHIADDGREVAVTDPDLAAARVRTKPALGIAEVLERVAPERPHERLARARHRVLGVNAFEEQPHGAILGADARALLLDDGAQDVRVLALERMAKVTPSGGVDAQVGGDEQRRDLTRDAGLAQHRDGGGDAIEHVADRRQRLLDGAEPALDSGLRGGRAFALRRVLEAKRGVRLHGSLGEVRRALVGDQLHALAPGGRVGDRADDQVLGLALVYGERVEQAALSVAHRRRSGPEPRCGGDSALGRP